MTRMPVAGPRCRHPAGRVLRRLPRLAMATVVSGTGGLLTAVLPCRSQPSEMSAART